MPVRKQDIPDDVMAALADPKEQAIPDDVMAVLGTFKKKVSGGVSETGIPATSPSTSLAPLTSEEVAKGVFSFSQFRDKKVPLPANIPQTQKTIESALKNVHFGAISQKQLTDLYNNANGKEVAKQIIKQYAPEATDENVDNPAIIEMAAKNIKQQNRINFANAEKDGVAQLDQNLITDVSDFNKSLPESRAGKLTGYINELKKDISIDDLDNNDKISDVISRIRKVGDLEQSYILDPKEKRLAAEKTNGILNTLNSRLLYNISRTGVSPTLNQLDSEIEQSVISKVMEGERGEKTDNTEKDQIKVNQFKLGLTVLEKSDPVLFKNVINSIAQLKKIPDTDFSNISKIGQDVDNQTRFRGAAYDPNLIDTETQFDYNTFGQKKAAAAGVIGEWMKGKGYKNMNQFPEKLIRQAAKETGIDNPEIVNSLVFDEKLGGYDAIPKSGWIDDVSRGIMQPLEGINSTLNSWNESPVQTYLRSKDLSGTFGSQKVPDKKGQYSDILSSEHSFTTDMFRGLGQFIPQILLTKGVGGGLAGAAELGGATLSAKQAKNVADYGGTFISTFLQSYGPAYEEHLQKTGDSNTAALIGTIDGISAAAFEEILPDVKIAGKAFDGLKQGLANDLVGLIRKGGDPAELLTKAQPFVQKFFKSATNTLVQENLEELGTQYVDFVTESIFDPKSAKDRNLNKELWDTFKSTTAAMILPSIMGATGGSFTKDFTTKSLHSAAINLDSYKESLQNSLDKEYISQDDYNKSLKILETHKQSIDNAPNINANGATISPEKKLDYALEDTKIKVYKANANQTEGVAKEMWETKIKQAEDVQREILMPKEAPVQEAKVAETTATPETTAAPATGEASGATKTDEQLFDKVYEKGLGINNILIPENKTESVSILKDQALSTPSNINDKLDGDEELTTDLIAANGVEKINTQIQSFTDQQKDPATTDQQTQEIDKHLSLLDRGLEKANILESKNNTNVSKEAKTTSETKGAEESVLNHEGAATATETTPLTQEAVDLLASIKEGSRPTFITKNIEKIATDNGIEVSGNMTAGDVVNALRKKNISPSDTIGDKVLKGEDSKPLVLYHGTSKGVTASQLKQSGQAGDYGSGIYLATDKREAEQRNSENIIEANIESPNHLVVGSPEYFNGIYKGLEEKYGSVIPRQAIGEAAKEAGYTSMEVERPEGKWIIAFEGAKILDSKKNTTEAAGSKEQVEKAQPKTEAKIDRKGLSDQLRTLLGNNPAALVGDINPNNRLSFKDIGFEKGDNIEDAIDKVIAYGGEFTELLKIIKADPNIKNVTLELVDRLPSGEMGLYHPVGHGEGKDGLLQISDQANVAYSLVHELNHFLTLDSKAAEDVKDTAGYKGIEELYNYIAAKKGKPVAGSATLENYGLTNVKEFMAEMFINPTFRKYVSDVFETNKGDIAKTNKFIKENKVSSFKEIISNFFRELFNKLVGRGEKGIEIDASKPVIDNVVKLATDLFLVGKDVTVGQTNSEGVVVPLATRTDSKAAALGLPGADKNKIINDFVKSSLESGATVADIKGALVDNGFTQEEAQGFIDSNKLKGRVTAEDQTQGFENKQKSILNRISESKNIPENIKQKFSDNLTYNPQSHSVARDMAQAIVKEFGVENSVTMAESGRFNGDVNSLIFAEAIDQTFENEQSAKTPEEKLKFAEQWADYSIRYDEAARQKGKFISAVYDFYKKSPLGIIIAERANRDEVFRKWFKNKEANYKEVFEEFSKEPEFQQFVKEKVETQLKSERAVTRMKRRNKIENIFDSAKFKGSALHSSIVPPQLWNAAVEVMKQAALAGESIASIIEQGINHIKANHTESWDVDQFRKEWEEKLAGIDKASKGERVLASIKSRLRKQIDFLNKQIEKGARIDVEKEKIDYDEEANNLREERDRLAAILNEMAPLEKKALTDEQLAKMAENAVKKSIEEYQRRIKERDISTKKKTKIETDELNRLRETRDELKKEYESIKKELTAPSDEEVEKKTKKRMLDRFRKRLSGMTDSQQEDVIRRSFKTLVENGALNFDEFKKIVASVMGMGELSPEEVGKITQYVKDINSVQDASDNVIKERTQKSIDDFDKISKTAERSATELGNIVNSKTDLLQRIRSIIQLNTLGVVSLIKNPVYNLFHQALVRLPKAVIMTGVDQAIYGLSLLSNKITGSAIIKPQTNIFLAQKGYFSKGKKGGSESVKQVFTGLTSLDYFQKEIRTSQIKPLQAWRDIWSWKKGEKFLSKAQIADKFIQGTVGIPAEAVARMLNIGDKPFRFAAEGAVSETIATQEFGLKGLDKEIFTRFPKEEATRLYKEKGLEHDAAVKKAEALEKRIIDEGEQAVFQQKNIVMEGLNGLGSMMKNFSEGNVIAKGGLGIAKILGTLNAPFLKTPLNIFWELFNLVTPEVAFAQSAIYGYMAGRAKYKGENEKAGEYAFQAKKWMAHGATGYSLLATFGYFASIGAISGGGDDDTAKERKGKKTYQKSHALNVAKVMRALSGGDTRDEDNDLMVDLSWFGAPGMIMNIQADRYGNMTQEERDKMSYLAEVTDRMHSAAADGLENSIFQGTIAGINAFKQGGRWVNTWAMNQANVGANFFQPATLAQFARATLPYNPAIKGDSFAQELKNNFASRSLLFRAFAGYPPSDITIWGDKAMRNNTGARGVAFNMLGFDEYNKDTFAEPIFQDYKRTGNSSFFPTDVRPTMTVDGQDKKMTVEQERQFKTLVGQARKSLVAPFVNDMATFKSKDREINGKTYNELTDEQKVKALNVVYKKGYEAGKAQFKELYSDFQSEKEREEE